MPLLERKDQLAALETAASRFLNPPTNAHRLANLIDMHLTRLGYGLATLDERAPGEAAIVRHNGQHPDCFVCGTAVPEPPGESKVPSP